MVRFLGSFGDVNFLKRWWGTCGPR